MALYKYHSPHGPICIKPQLARCQHIGGTLPTHVTTQLPAAQHCFVQDPFQSSIWPSNWSLRLAPAPCGKSVWFLAAQELKSLHLFPCWKREMQNNKEIKRKKIRKKISRARERRKKKSSLKQNSGNREINMV